MDIQAKKCSRCKIEKDLNLFCKNINGMFGRNSRCRECKKLDHIEALAGDPNLKETRRQRSANNRIKYRERVKTDKEFKQKMLDRSRKSNAKTRDRCKVDEEFKKRRAAKRRAWRAAESGSRSHKNSRLKLDYGITLTEYDATRLAQNNKCAICGKSETSICRKTGKPYELAVDHDHETGKVRALLCAAHNVALGMLNDNFDDALKLAKYIQEHKGII